MFSFQRYRVSIWSYQFHPHHDPSLLLRKETVSSTDETAVHQVMRQAGIQTAHLAKVVDLRTNTCRLLRNITLPTSNL